MITGFFTAAISKLNGEYAKLYLNGLNSGNFLKRQNYEWGFTEFISSKTMKPKGTPFQTWSAAAGIIGYKTVIEKRKLFV
jgi:hypothetical protein